jgi:hypothetical protein
MSPRAVRKAFPGYRLIDLPTGRVLASTEDDLGWIAFVRSRVRAVLEREGRDRAATLGVISGDVFEDDASPLEAPTTGDELVSYAFDEPWPNPHEPPVGLDPQSLTEEWWEDFPEVKLEYWDDVLCGSRPMRATLLRALLVNMGLREVVRLAPRELWLQALQEHQPPGEG